MLGIARRVPGRLGVAAVTMLLATLGCSRTAEPATPDSPAAPAASALSTHAAQAADLGQLLSRGEYETIVAAAPVQLQAARARNATPAECWEIEHVFLLALAHTVPQKTLVERWRYASTEYAEVIDPAFLGELIWHGGAPAPHQMDTELMLASSPVFRERSQAALGKPAARDPYGHPEGFPRAWLAPDER